MDEIELSKISKFIVEEIKNLPAELTFEDAAFEQCEDPESFVQDYIELNKRNRFLSIHPWFLRCSWMKKVSILKRFAWCITNLNTLLLIINTIYTATTKDYIISTTQGLNLFKYDKILNDNNRTLDESVLEAVIENETNWYKTLNDCEQYITVVGMIQLADSGINGKIFYEFVKIFKSRYREIFMVQYLEELRLRPPPPQVDETKTTKKGKKGKKDKKEKKEKKEKKDKKEKKEKKVKKEKTPEEEAAEIEKEKEKQRQKELDDILAFLNEQFPDNSKEPETIQLISLMQKWDTFMTAYKKKVGLGPPKKEPKKKKEKKDKGKKGKKGKDKKKKEKISKDLPDDIQLLPIWINKKLIASIEPKTFKKSKKTNKYWNFIAKGIKQDTKCRKTLNKNCTKLKKKLKIVEIESTIPVTKLAEKFTKVSEVTDSSIRANFKSNKQTTNTLVADLYRTCTAFNLCGTPLQSFPRQIYIPDGHTSFCSIFSNQSSKIM